MIGGTAVVGLLEVLGVIAGGRDGDEGWGWVRMREEVEKYGWRFWGEIGLLSVNIVISLFIVPVGLLFGVQIKNLL